MALRPERQTLLIVSAGTSTGSPPWTAAWRAVIWPAPAWRTWPMITYSTSSGAIPARSTALRMATPPSSTAGTVLRPPPNLPIAVRAPATMTVLISFELRLAGLRARRPAPSPRLGLHAGRVEDAGGHPVEADQGEELEQLGLGVAAGEVRPGVVADPARPQDL